MSLGLVQGAFLLGLLTVAIPIIIHLIFRRPPKPVELGSIRFLQELFKKHARRQKIQRWLLLALRILGIVLLALMFARPYFVERVGGSGERFLAVLIDRSASMQLRRDGRTLLGQALQQARRVIDGAGADTKVEVAFFDSHIWPLANLNESSSGPRGTRAMLDATNLPPTTYRATNYGTALRWAADICAKTTRGRKDVHVFTDLQRSGLEWSEIQSLPEDVIVHVHDLGLDLPNNVAVIGAEASRRLVPPGEDIRVRATVFNAGPFALDEVPVVLKLTNENRPIRLIEKVKLEPDAMVTVDFELPFPADGFWEGSVTVEVVDDLAFDNRRHLAVMVAPAYHVLVVDGQPHELPHLSETYYLETALRLAPPNKFYRGSPYRPTVISGGERIRLPVLDDVNAVVLANVPRVEKTEAQRLARFVRRGGGLLVFCGDQVSSAGYSELQEAGLTVGEIEANSRSEDLPWRLGKWDENSPILQPFNDPQHGDLRRLAFLGCTRIRPQGDTTVLAKFRREIPALLERKLGQGRILWFVSACDRDWSDLPRGRLFLPLVHQMLGHFNGLNEGGPVRDVMIDADAAFGDDEALGNDAVPGVYPQGNHWSVVNVDPRESETERCTKEEFVNRFELTSADQNEPTPARLAATGLSAYALRESEFWHWVLFALFGLLALEYLIANRTPASS